MISRKFFAARNRSRILLLSSFAVALLVQCSGNKPRVEVMENGVYVAKEVSSYGISGYRDGATTRASAMLTIKDGDRIHLSLDVTYNPTPELASGHWNREGKAVEEGEVRAESIKFLGGQGATPSVGGRFVLESFGNPRMRVYLPARELIPMMP